MKRGPVFVDDLLKCLDPPTRAAVEEQLETCRQTSEKRYNKARSGKSGWKAWKGKKVEGRLEEALAVDNAVKKEQDPDVKKEQDSPSKIVVKKEQD